MLYKNKLTKGQRGGSVVKDDYSEIISSFKREETGHLLLVTNIYKHTQIHRYRHIGRQSSMQYINKQSKNK